MSKKINIILEIDECGDVHGLYTDDINLFAIGKITNVRKASNVEFNVETQKWEVTSLNGKVLHENTNREKAIGWEIMAFSPGGKYYEN